MSIDTYIVKNHGWYSKLPVSSSFYSDSSVIESVSLELVRLSQGDVADCDFGFSSLYISQVLLVRQLSIGCELTAKAQVPIKNYGYVRIRI